MSLQRCQKETTSTEFVEWIEYFRQDFNVRRREDYFLANIACEIRRSVVKNPKSVKLKPFLLEFETKPIKKERRNTLNTWLAWARVKSRKK